MKSIPQKPTSSKLNNLVSEDKIQTLINQGGSVASEKAQKPLKKKNNKVLLTVDWELLNRVDECVSKRVINKARTNYILEAIVEKLEREAQK
ncbi:MAG: hypothetical protein J0H68_09480 [Sphingobacteriia bacterium]|nr:hypothetical protein [Sphingobacteriia bacterium]